MRKRRIETTSRVMTHIQDRRMRAKRCRMRKKRELRRRKNQIKKYIGSRRFREDMFGIVLGALTGMGVVLFYILFGFA